MVIWCICAHILGGTLLVWATCAGFPPGRDLQGTVWYNPCLTRSFPRLWPRPPYNMWGLGSTCWKKVPGPYHSQTQGSTAQLRFRLWQTVVLDIWYWECLWKEQLPKRDRVLLVSWMASPPQHPLTSLNPCFILKKSTLHCGKQSGRHSFIWSFFLFWNSWKKTVAWEIGWPWYNQLSSLIFVL